MNWKCSNTGYFSLDDTQVILNVPRGSLVFKELRNGSKPTWRVLLKSIALSMHPVSAARCHRQATFHERVSHGIDPSPRQTTKKCNSKIWLEDPTPKRILTKWCRCLPGSHFGKSYRIKLKKKNLACNKHACLSIVGPHNEKISGPCSFHF